MTSPHQAFTGWLAAVMVLVGGSAAAQDTRGTIRGVVVARVEPMSPGFDAAIERGHVILEVNRQPVQNANDYRRLTAGVRPGDILAIYVYKPELNQRILETVRVDAR